MVRKKSALLVASDRQDESFSAELDKAVAAVSGKKAEHVHGKADQEYLITAGAASNVVRTLEVREDALNGQKYLAGYTEEEHTSCKIQARQVIWAQSEEEARTIAMGRAMGVKRKNAVPEGFEERVTWVRVKQPKTLSTLNRDVYKNVPKITRTKIVADAGDLRLMADILQHSGTGYSATFMPVKAEAITEQEQGLPRHLPDTAKIAELRAGLERAKAMADPMIINGYIRDLREYGIKA